jgi:zinc transporter ZupT
LSLGAATGIGGLLVLMLRRVSDRVVSFSMGFASGVMLLVAFNNLFLEAEQLITHYQFWKVCWRNFGEFDFAIDSPLISGSPSGRIPK